MDQDRVYMNIKHRPGRAPWALFTWLALYFVPGIIVGRYVNGYAGMAVMAAGAALLVAMAWRCFYPTRLVAGRDGFTVDCARGSCPHVGYDKIHEARWEKAPRLARCVFGPLVFLEPLWPFQARRDMRLTIVYAGDPIVLTADEYDRLEEFVEALKKRNVLGLAGESKRPIVREFGK